MNDFTDAHDFFDLWVLDEFKEPVKDAYSDSLTEAGQVYFNTFLRILDGQEYSENSMVDQDENESGNPGHTHLGASALLWGWVFIDREVSRG
ncbi:hypothetical protein LWI29_023117 [Acer saccharum]|uniref:Uncharacterized protein n=1 Tax=Acer saccharum TaxID=4024 RepID=A0AA39VC52_ACESA|nr:hypothetical protein LWI29_023117 [Acer saccharum]